MLNPTLLRLEGPFQEGHALTSALLHRREKREGSAKHGLQEVVGEEVQAKQMLREEGGAGSQSVRAAAPCFWSCGGHS